jgi:hypothetical protein
MTTQYYVRIRGSETLQILVLDDHVVIWGPYSLRTFGLYVNYHFVPRHENVNERAAYHKRLAYQHLDQ